MIFDYGSCSISVALSACEVLVGLLPAQSKLSWAVGLMGLSRPGGRVDALGQLRPRELGE